MKNALAVFRREFKAYFDSPVAYVFLTAFLVLAGFLTFCMGFFYERRQADLAPFFFWHPWIYLLLVPAATMGLWADERRNGTMEQLLTLPVTVCEVLTGKFLAAWAFVGIGLALTFPVALTAGYLGSPDWGAVACGYFGSLLLAGASVAIGLFASSLSRSSVVAFVVALVMLFALLLVGFAPVTGALASWGVPAAAVDAVASLSLLSHYEALGRAVVDLADVGYYAAVAVFFLAAAKTVTEGRRGAPKGAAALALLAVSLGAAVAVLANLPLRADFTAERLYTLSDGSKAVLAKLDRDVTLKFYVSSSVAEMSSRLKIYASRVENLLGEYERAAGGRLAVEKYDPAPDSDAEEWAQRYGVEPQQSNPFAQPVYFGLVAVCGDREETIQGFSPNAESTLEYDVTRLVTRVVWPERPAIGVMTSLEDVLPAGDAMFAMRAGRRPQQGWVSFSELSKDYDVRPVPVDAEAIDEDIRTLVVLHAKDLSAKTLYAIDQFVCRGGRLVACVDPLSAKDLMSAVQSGGMPAPGGMSSTLGALFDAWGVGFDVSKVVCDLDASTKLNMGRGQTDEPSFLTLGRDGMAHDDILVSRLTQVMLPFAGAFTFDPSKGEGLTFTPVVSTSADHSSLADSSSVAMGGTLRQARPDGAGARVVAARLEGEFKSAFPQGPDGTNAVEGALAGGRGSVLLVGDSDFLSDDFCVQVSRTPFGNIVQPINDNLSLFSNIVEMFAGREELIGLRTRGASSRPFEVVDRLEAAAVARWQRKEEELQSRLQEAQQRINQLQAQKSAGERSFLSREQQDEILKARRAQAETRRELKNVRKELTASIDALGTRIKFLNIVFIPAVVAVLGVLRGFLRRRG